MPRTILIEDEYSPRRMLREKLELLFPDLEIVAECENAEDALIEILRLAIEVQGATYPTVVSSLAGNLMLRTGFPSNVRLDLHNTGNTDALGVFAYLALPSHIEISTARKDFREVIDPVQSFEFYCEEFGQSYSISNSQILALMDGMNYESVPIDTVFGAPFNGKIYQIYMPQKGNLFSLCCSVPPLCNSV